MTRSSRQADTPLVAQLLGQLRQERQALLDPDRPCVVNPSPEVVISHLEAQAIVLLLTEAPLEEGSDLALLAEHLAYELEGRTDYYDLWGRRLLKVEASGARRLLQ